jgi:uncharacterized membrane protein YphA (DoxX/SURF4 family)
VAGPARARTGANHSKRVTTAHPFWLERRGMNTLLWIFQVLLAAVFLATGLTKLTQPRVKMAAGPMGWAEDVTDRQFRAVGAVELLGALGLVLPAALKVATVLTPIAALGLSMTMIGAILTHVRLGETNRLWPAILLFAVALFVAVARLGPYSL